MNAVCACRPRREGVFKDKRFQEISGALVIFCGIILCLSLVSFHPGDEKHLFDHQGVKNMIGPLGSSIAYALMVSLGFASYVFVAAALWTGSAFFRALSGRSIAGRLLAYFFLALAVAGFVSVFKTGDPVYAGGAAGSFIHHVLVIVAGEVGACLVILAMNICALILLGVLSLASLVQAGGGKLKILGERIIYLRKREKGSVPLINIEAVGRGGKLPWIEKRRIILYDPNAIREMTPALSGRGTPVAEDFVCPGEYIEEFITPDEAPVEALYVPATGSGGQKTFTGSSVFEAEFREIPPPVLEGSESLCGTVTTLPEESLVILVEKDVSGMDSVSQDDTAQEEIIPEEANAEEFTGECGFETAGVSEESPVMEEPSVQPEKRRARIHSLEAEEKKPESRIVDCGTGDYSIPVSYLRFSAPRDNESYEQEIKRNSVLLVNTLLEFGIESRVVNVNRGPVITLYEMQIAPGIKVNKIVSLSDDIAMALAASRVRIVAPIPGKSAIGVEVPNIEREMVTLGDILSSEKYQSQTGALKVALGKDVLGKPVTLDLKKLPHLLIAGATGSGKSVCVNGIITSIVYNYDPSHVRFILVDPKMVELQVYNGLPHLLTPVITEPHMAPLALKWAIYEMEKRYRLLSEMNTRDIERYNEKIREIDEKREPLPYIITIIDELADLMMVASKDIEGYITRIAQKARAVGIHLVLATQRPSVDIITGIIKANFPARIAFQVAQKTDSRTIIDQNGAEKLLGKGDMLYQSPMSSFPIRVQGAFIGEDEIGRMVDHLAGRYDVRYIDLEECLVFTEEEKTGEEGEDELFVDALKIVEETRKASASYLQRRLQIGYNRAARLIEQMEELGYVGPQQGSKPREVFI